MTLQKFLEDKAHLTDQQALDAARNHKENQGRLLAGTTVNSVLAELDLTADVQAISVDPTHVARHKMASVILGIQGGEPFNFMQGDPQGERVLNMLDWVGANAPEVASQWPLFKAAMIAMSNREVEPLANVTLYDVLLVRGTCPTKPVVAQSGYLLPTLTQNVESHQARITAKNPRTNQRQILGRVNLSGAGMYEFKIPTHYLQHTDYQIDDPYGAIE